MAVAFSLYDRWDKPITRLQVLSAKHSEELNGEDTLTIEAFYELNKGQRIVWRDHLGAYHEHIVDSITKTHAEGKPVTKAVCVNSVAELWNDYIDDRRLGIQSPVPASTMLSAALEPTRWALGSNTIDTTGTVTFYHTSAREAIQAVQEAVGGELETTITTNATGVTSRRVTVVALRGNQDSPKRFTYTKDINTISRTVETDECISQLYVFGKGVEMDSGGYGRRLTIESVNGGKKYLESATAKAQWGRPDGNGGIAHSTGVVVFDDCEDATQLKSLGQAEFSKRQVPKLSYTLSVVDLASMGFTYEGVGLGDSVSIVDAEFDPEIRAKGRVTRIERDLLEQSATVTIGNITENLAKMLRKQAADLAALKRRGSAWQLMSESDLTYLEQLRSAINDAFSDNRNYKYDSFELGTLYSNVPCDENTFSPIQPLPSGVAPWAMNLSSAGFRISSSLNANGTWKWTTFGTGEGFTADALIAGTIQSAAYRATGTGDHWILGQNGYLEAYNSKFHDAQITGQLTTESGNLKTRVVGGKIEIYYDNVLLGTIEGAKPYSNSTVLRIKSAISGGLVELSSLGRVSIGTSDGTSISATSTGFQLTGTSGGAISADSSGMSISTPKSGEQYVRFDWSGKDLTVREYQTSSASRYGTAVTTEFGFWDQGMNYHTFRFVNGICVEAH